jgi:Holliday junction resolvase RusA-like endonuclease
VSATVQELIFHVPGKPVSQPRQRLRVVRTKRGFRAHNYVSRTALVQFYKAKIQETATHARAAHPGRWRTTGPFQVDINFVFPCPKRDNQRDTQRHWYAGIPDLDNLVKAVCDALSGLLWDNDSQVVSCSAAKFYAKGDAPTETLVWVRSLS